MAQVESTDYYDILGVRKDADTKTIQRAYRKLARKYHPDLNKDPEAEARFKAINEANAVLSDPARRAKYDRLHPVLGADWDRVPDDFDPAAAAAAQGAGTGFGTREWTSFDDAHFEDLFGSLFGRRPPTGPVRGPDQEAIIQIGLREAYEGTQRRITVGSGSRERSFTARIPAGITDGQTIRLAGKGGAGINGGPNGDLYLHVQVRPEAPFRVSGRDVTVPLRLSPWEAALGTTVSVPTPTGEARVRVPAGTSSGRRLKLPGHGIPRRGGTAGDLYAQIEIVVPDQLDAKQRELFEALADASKSFDPRRDGAIGGADGR
jgi:curved DNA-binding protein